MFIGLTLTPEEIQLIGWIVAIGTTLATVYFARKARPIEKLSLDLSIIQTRNEFLERRVTELDEKEETQRDRIDKLNTEVALLREEKKVLTDKVLKSEETVNDQIQQITNMQTQVINSQVAANLMRNQVEAIVKRFNIPRTIGEMGQRDK